MRGAKAKKIRRRVYKDFSLRDRRYFRDNKTGTITRESRRRQYQWQKGRGHWSQSQPQ